MRIRVTNEKEFWAGVVFMTIGAAALSQLPKYKIGHATNMGPGYFLRLTGIILVFLDAIAAFRGLTMTSADKIGRWPLTPLFFVTVGALAFSFLLEWLGLAAATLRRVTTNVYGGGL